MLKYEKFKLTQYIDNMKIQFLNSTRAAQMVREYDQGKLGVHNGRKTEGDLVVEDRKMHVTLQRILQTKPQA